MAYVQPRERTHDIAAAALRQATRFVAIASYAVAVAVALVILSPVLPGRGPAATAVVPTGPEPILYTVKDGDTFAGIAASHGISLARLFALNPKLTPLTDANSKQIVIGPR
jgi:LysM repeat protein